GGGGFGSPVVLEAQGLHAPSFVQQGSTKLKGCFPCMLIFFTNNTFNIENVEQYCTLN
ncbi:unnamed protein product, partial [Callosobruchus maculatus]